MMKTVKNQEMLPQSWNMMKINKTFRALVMGDIFRRLVSRTLAQQLGAQLQEACAPFQYALTTRAGTEALARALRFATESHQSTTVVSVDGVGAYDHTSRSCMFQSLRDCPALPPLIPLVRVFYGGDSEYLFYEESGQTHAVSQAEGGEQGDPLMPDCSRLAFTAHCRRPIPPSTRVRTCVHFRMTHTSCARPNAQFPPSVPSALRWQSTST